MYIDFGRNCAFLFNQGSCLVRDPSLFHTREKFNWAVILQYVTELGITLLCRFFFFSEEISMRATFHSLSNHSALFPSYFSPLHYMTMLEHDFKSKTIGELTHNSNHFRSEVMFCCAIMKMTQHSFSMESI